MKQNSVEIYTSEKEKYEDEYAIIKRKLRVSSSLRLLLFVSIVVGIYLFLENLTLSLGIGFVGIAIFLILVSNHVKLQYQRDLLKELILINDQELRVLKGDFHHLEDGAEFHDSKHYYSHDIDLFGRGSLFQFINRSVIKSGKSLLADLFK